MTIHFYVNEILTHVNVGEVYPSSFDFGDPLIGVGEANLTIPIPITTGEQSLLRRLIANHFELVIVDGILNRGGAIIWAGWIDKRIPDPAKAEIKFHATHWKGWFYRREVPPGTFPNNFIKKDELEIAYDLFRFATASVGAPQLTLPAMQGGIVRELTVKPWTKVGEAVDDLAKRDGGFEWSIGFRIHPVADVLELYLEVWEPGQNRSSNLLLLLDSSNTTNRISVGAIPEDGTIEATRVYATSDGDEPVFAKDEEPTLGLSPNTLLLERHTTYQDNRNPQSLYDYARAERIERSNPYSEVPVSFAADNPSISSFRTGDRARLVVRDAWRNLDAPGIRIVDRSVAKTPNTLATATVSLDMNDIRVIA